MTGCRGWLNPGRGANDRLPDRADTLPGLKNRLPALQISSQRLRASVAAIVISIVSALANTPPAKKCPHFDKNGDAEHRRFRDIVSTKVRQVLGQVLFLGGRLPIGIGISHVRDRRPGAAGLDAIIKTKNRYEKIHHVKHRGDGPGRLVRTSRRRQGPL